MNRASAFLMRQGSDAEPRREDGHSFFLRHAYFTGADEPYAKLKRALRADIDKSAWSTLYSTKSRPFAPPDSRKIAVKVIKHYGDEVLKVYRCNLS